MECNTFLSAVDDVPNPNLALDSLGPLVLLLRLLQGSFSP